MLLTYIFSCSADNNNNFKKEEAQTLWSWSPQMPLIPKSRNTNKRRHPQVLQQLVPTHPSCQPAAASAEHTNITQNLPANPRDGEKDECVGHMAYI